MTEPRLLPTGGRLIPYLDRFPRVADDAYIADGVKIVGDVEIGSSTNIWFNCVVRGDEQSVRIGERVNIQDGSVIHVSGSLPGTRIGDDVTIAHMCLVHACTLEDGAFVGMGAMVLDGAVIEAGAMLGAGAMLTPGKRLPAGELWVGRPARFARKLDADDLEAMRRTARVYAERGQEYLQLVRSGG